jgi:ATP-dependent Lon protease
VEELRERVEELELTEDARTEIERELKRLERTSPQSAEYQVIRTFLEWVTELPWGDRTEDKLDLKKAADILEEDHYGLEDVKDRVLEFLAVRKLQAERALEDEEGDETRAEVEDEEDEEERDRLDEGVGRGPILLFGGPPGTGKTSIAQSIARALGRKYVRISLGGARDEADIRGHRRTYVGAMPGRIIQGMRQVKSKNPVFLLDEVDKLGVSFQGDPSSALLEVLDPAQNSSFTDHYLGIPFDLSEVLFIATANYVDRIPPPLLDRMERVEFVGYTEKEKLEIAKRYLLPRQQREAGLRDDELDAKDDSILSVIQKYTREAGVRQLERELGKLSRKVARKIAAGELENVEMTPETVRELLGRPRVHPEQMAPTDSVGVATGMFYTPMGGDIMFVEASVMQGKGGLVLTGQLGDVMKESGRAALSYAKAQHERLGIPSEALDDREVHIHVPAGAVPKDGPSAGITMATALVSALSGRKVRRDVAMTGELTLTGRVLPIGGLKEKILGAVRAGITEIILPRENEADLEDIPEEVAENLTFHTVEDLDSVIRIALLDEKPKAGSRAKGGAETGGKKGPSSKKAPRKKKDESSKEIRA